MKARLFILADEPFVSEQSMDAILKQTFADVLTDNDAVQYFSSLKDATVAIGKAFSDSDTVLFFAETRQLAETKEILCKALGMELTVDEELLGVALKTASSAELDAAFFNVCHAGIAKGAHVFALADALFAGFACKRGRQTVVLLPMTADRTKVLLTSQVIPYLNKEAGVKINAAPLHFYFAEQLSASMARNNIKIAVAPTKAAEVFMRYLTFVPSMEGRVLSAPKAEKRGNTPPNEYVVNLSITAAEFKGLPYGIAISNAYYVGDDLNAPKTVYIAVTNDAETRVRELTSFYGEGTSEFLFRCCSELCRLLSRIIDADTGAAEKIDKKTPAQERRSIRRFKVAIAVAASLLLLVAGAGGYYFHSHSYTLKDWSDRYLGFLPTLHFTGDELESEPATEPAAQGTEEAPAEETPADDAETPAAP